MSGNEHQHPTGKQPSERLRIENRFWSKVDYGDCDPDECWEWRDEHATRCGYGVLWVDGTTIPAHRVAYALDTGHRIGSIDADVVRHLCSSKRCCNPSHLTTGTHYANHLDAVRAGAKDGLSRSDTRLIRAAYPDLPAKVLADRMGVTRAAIHRIVTGDTHRG